MAEMSQKRFAVTKMSSRNVYDTEYCTLQKLLEYSLAALKAKNRMELSLEELILLKQAVSFRVGQAN